MTGPYDDGDDPTGLFDHLDDPAAPTPGREVLTSVVHRGRRLRARRQSALALTGAAGVALAVLGGLGLSHEVDAGRGRDSVITPAQTPTPFASVSVPAHPHRPTGVAVIVPGAGPARGRTTHPAAPPAPGCAGTGSGPGSAPASSSPPGPTPEPSAGGTGVEPSPEPTTSAVPCPTASPSGEPTDLPSPSPSGTPAATDSPSPEPSQSATPGGQVDSGTGAETSVWPE